jgi:hypothetical protein
MLMEKLLVMAIIFISAPSFADSGDLYYVPGQGYVPGYEMPQRIDQSQQQFQVPSAPAVPDQSRSYIPDAQPYPVRSSIPEPPAPYNP